MKGAVVLSFDCELGWGRIEDDGWMQLERGGAYRRTRTAISKLSRVFGDRALGSTWAFVGSLFAEDGRDVPLDHLPVGYRRSVERFLTASDPATRSLSDLIPEFRRMGHVLDPGSHSATHVRPRTPGADRETIVTDVRLSLDQVRAVFGDPVSSVVLPRDEVDYLEDVGGLAALSIRVPGATYGSSDRSVLVRAQRALRRTCLGPAPAVTTDLDGGSRAQSGSLYFNWAVGGGLSKSLRRVLLRSSVDRMVERLVGDGGVFHVWVHPFNFGESTALLDDFLAFVDRLTTLRDAGSIVIEGMAPHHARTRRTP